MIRLGVMCLLCAGLACAGESGGADVDSVDAGAADARSLSCDATASDPRNCGACGRTCVIPHGTAACEDGECVVAACDEGYYDDDGEADNGCEREGECSGDSETCEQE